MLSGINGLALADRVRERYPSIEIMFMSGYPFRTLSSQFGMPQNLLRFFLAKPFQIEALTRKIWEVLRRRVLPGFEIVRNDQGSIAYRRQR